jgi:hypothetical protein
MTMQNRKAEKLISQHLNFVEELKFAKGREVSKIIWRQVGVEPPQRFKATYRLVKMPWGEGPQQVRLELAEPASI